MSAQIITEEFDAVASIVPQTLTKLLVPTTADAGMAIINAIKSCAEHFPLPAGPSDADMIVSHGHESAFQAQRELAEFVKSGRVVRMLMPQFDQGVALGPFITDVLKRRSVRSIFVDGTKFFYASPKQIETMESDLREIAKTHGIFVVIVFSLSK